MPSKLKEALQVLQADPRNLRLNVGAFFELRTEGSASVVKAVQELTKPDDGSHRFLTSYLLTRLK